jgi:hypothetical protein
MPRIAPVRGVHYDHHAAVGVVLIDRFFQFGLDNVLHGGIDGQLEIDARSSRLNFLRRDPDRVALRVDFRRNDAGAATQQGDRSTLRCR